MSDNVHSTQTHDLSSDLPLLPQDELEQGVFGEAVYGSGIVGVDRSGFDQNVGCVHAGYLPIAPPPN
jgi:hypothetical protein